LQRGKARAIRFLLGAMLMTGSLFLGCGNQEPIKIGFAGTLMGNDSGRSINARDGVILAVEQLNTSGGIKGRKLELLVRDDQRDFKVAAAMDQEMAAQGAVAIIGHLSSTVIYEIMNELNRSRILLISPAANAALLKGKDDYILAVQEENERFAARLAREAARRGCKRAAVVYDLSNAVFSREWYQVFKAEFAALGGSVVFDRCIVSGVAVNLYGAARDLMASKPDLALSICNSFDTAILFQQIRTLDGKILLFSTDWAITDDFMNYGGPAVDGVTVAEAFNPQSPDPAFQKFKAEYRRRFDSEPSSAAMLGYEAMGIIAAALRRSKSYRPEVLKDAIIRQRSFPGLQDLIRINRYGDADRRIFLLKVKGQSFVEVKENASENFAKDHSDF
jgi:branched-chain amino acid transport system substrate-binding protein